MVLRKSNKKPELKDVAFTGEESVRPFIFGVLNLTGLSFFCFVFGVLDSKKHSEDESLSSTQSYEQLGTIKVVIHHITNVCASQSPPRLYTALKENVLIHERAKKSVTHQVL